MKIATWNVNSIRRRQEQIAQFLQENTVDVLLLQELKCTESDFPADWVDDLGYNSAVLGQKTFNGVAILSKFPLEDVQKGLPYGDDPQARYIEAFTGGVRVASVYVPNGQEVGSEKYIYKLTFLEFLNKRLKQLRMQDEMIVIGGDFNIAPQDIDVYDPELWRGRILCSDLERAAYQMLLDTGYVDILRAQHADTLFTWWDYRAAHFARGKGLRIDHLLISHAHKTRCMASGVEKKFRGQATPSDHAPVWCTLES